MPPSENQNNRDASKRYPPSARIRKRGRGGALLQRPRITAFVKRIGFGLVLFSFRRKERIARAKCEKVFARVCYTLFMDQFISPPLREKLWSIFLTGLLATLLSMLQGVAAANGVECGPAANPAVAAPLAMALRAGLYTVRIA